MYTLTLSDIKRRFSSHPESVQLVALVSPTGAVCLHGARVVLDIFYKSQSPRLQLHLVWLPMLTADNLETALAQEASFQNEQVIQYWDSKRTLGRMVARVLNLAIPIAWDVYLLYSPRATWQGRQMPAPDFWMHQLDERPDLHLDPDRLLVEVKKAIQAITLGDEKPGKFGDEAAHELLDHPIRIVNRTQLKTCPSGQVDPFPGYRDVFGKLPYH